MRSRTVTGSPSLTVRVGLRRRSSTSSRYDLQALADGRGRQRRVVARLHHLVKDAESRRSCPLAVKRSAVAFAVKARAGAAGSPSSRSAGLSFALRFPRAQLRRILRHRMRVALQRQHRVRRRERVEIASPIGRSERLRSRPAVMRLQPLRESAARGCDKVLRIRAERGVEIPALARVVLRRSCSL